MVQAPITINPITRVEGHGKVTIHLDDRGEVAEARFHVLQFRGFEVFCRGRPYEEMPIITQRICGICPVSHQLASAKACDAVMGFEIPPAARALRELIHYGQYIQSHALHFFYLASPDLLLGWDAPPAQRNVVGLADVNPVVVKKAIHLRKFGQEIIKALGGKKVHPAFAVPGGVTNPLDPQDRDRLLAGFDEAFQTADIAWDILETQLSTQAEEFRAFANFDSNWVGLVDEWGQSALYDGRIRIAGPDGSLLAEFDPADYPKYIAERTEAWSYMKFPYYEPQGYPDGLYRVGPLARLNVADGLSTPRAARRLEEFRRHASDGLMGASLMYHQARLVELVYALEKAQELLQDSRILGRRIKATRPPAHGEGVGVVEAPRGTLIHHYWVRPDGTMEKANLIVATGHNNLAMNRAVALVAKAFIHDGDVREGLLNRVEGAIRCYDPCLSCATHALGQMPLVVRILDSQGNVRHELKRD
jgi:NAD-reducing hydrogenase large subunit